MCIFTPTLLLLNLTDVLVPSSPRVVEALDILLDFISEYPEMNAILFDSQSFLRKIKHLTERGIVLLH
jgi:hypothetical protein